MTRGRVFCGAAEIQLDVLAGGKGLAGAGDDKRLGLVIDGEIVEYVVHVEMQLRRHGIALVRPIERHPGDAFVLLDQKRLVFFGCGHGILLLCGLRLDL